MFLRSNKELIDQSSYPPDLDIKQTELLGVSFQRLHTDTLIDYLTKTATNRQSKTVCHTNIHGMNIAYEQSRYRKLLNEADLVYCDGFGVLMGAWLMGYTVSASQRQTCPDWIEGIAHACQKKNLSIFLLAGKPGIAEIAVSKLKQTVPNLQVEAHHGFFEKSGAKNQEIVERINAFAPDILCVGFGMPLQESWVQANKEQINAGLFLTIGACLDYYTGQYFRGPRWMTDGGLEWLTRLFTHPKRLGRRYLIGNPLFFFRVLKSRFARKRAKNRLNQA